MEGERQRRKWRESGKKKEKEGPSERATNEIVVSTKSHERTISMDASQVLWEKWQEQVKGLWPQLHGHQQKLLALVVAGMVVSGCAVLQRVAEEIQQQGWSEAKMSSIQRRLERFLANDQVRVTDIWK